MTVGALNNGFTPEHPARLLVGLPGRQPAVQELRVRVLRDDRLRQGAADLLRHVLLPGRLPLLAEVRHRPDRRERQGPAGRARPRPSASASPTGIDLPGEASGRIADRHWKLAYWKSMKGYYCGIDRKQRRHQRLPAALRPRVLPRGQLLPRRRRGELRDRPGRHAGHAAPARPRVRRALQRRHALRAAGRQGDRQPRRQGAQADRARRSPATSKRRPRASRYVDQALLGTAEDRHHGLEVHRLPARQGPHPRQDRLGRGLRQAVDLVGRVLRQELRRA